MQWFDQISLPAMIILPLIGAAFLLFIPEHEFALRKRVAIFIVLSTGIFHIRNSIQLFRTQIPRLDLNVLTPLGFKEDLSLTLDLHAFLGISFLLVALYLFLYCSLSKNIQAMQLDSKILFLMSLATALMLTANFGVFLLGQMLIAQAILIFNLREGGPRRSSSSLAASITFSFLDLAAYLVWKWQADLSMLEPVAITFIIWLPMITRLLIPFFSPWARLFFANSATEISILYLCASFMAAIVALARYDADLSFIAPLASVSGFFAAVLALSDKHISQFLMRLISVSGALALYLLATPSPPDVEAHVLAYCGTLTLLISLGLLIQRVFTEDTPEKFEKELRPIWFTVLMLISGLPFLGVGAFIWQIFPSQSLLWLSTFALLAFTTFSRVRPAIAPRTQSSLIGPTIYNRATIANLWSCISVIVIVSIALQLLFSQMVLPT